MALITGTNGLGKEIYDGVGIEAMYTAAGFTQEQKDTALQKISTFADVIIQHFRTNADLPLMESPAGTFNPTPLPAMTTYTTARGYKAGTIMVFLNSAYQDPNILPTPPVIFTPPNTVKLAGNTTTSRVTLIFTPTDF